jgi:hypothetical protein
MSFFFFVGNAIASPLLWFLTKSAERGAQTPLFVALDDSLGRNPELQ